MKIHFIAIGGSAMHNLAIALKLRVLVLQVVMTRLMIPPGQDLKNNNLLPQKEGWFSR